MLYCEYNRIGGIELKIETTSSFIMMVGWKNIANSVKGFLTKYIKATYLEVAQTKTFHVFRRGLRIWWSLIDGGDIVTKGFTWLILNLWCVGTIALPIADFMRSIFLGQAYVYPLAAVVFYISIISLALLGLIAIRIYIEWRRYYHSSNHLS